ncbi:hypothetical protein QBC47DRAFT_407285 [Echria macrotheca]|uniref:Uncharacterized protein n=1 Tax=Echria macrotheca TaxID=438768 RepID=A0AAJ0F0F1_9PEZI|nr:hypothetical protein QBC47DRAFT_407285 [Echria macrotheca]
MPDTTESVVRQNLRAFDGGPPVGGDTSAQQMRVTVANCPTCLEESLHLVGPPIKREGQEDESPVEAIIAVAKCRSCVAKSLRLSGEKTAKPTKTERSIGIWLPVIIGLCWYAYQGLSLHVQNRTDLSHVTSTLDTPNDLLGLAGDWMTAVEDLVSVRPQDGQTRWMAQYTADLSRICASLMTTGPTDRDQVRDIARLCSETEGHLLAADLDFEDALATSAKRLGKVRECVSDIGEWLDEAKNTDLGDRDFFFGSESLPPWRLSSRVLSSNLNYTAFPQIKGGGDVNVTFSISVPWVHRHAATLMEIMQSSACKTLGDGVFIDDEKHPLPWPSTATSVADVDVAALQPVFRSKVRTHRSGLTYKQRELLLDRPSFESRWLGLVRHLVAAADGLQELVDLSTSHQFAAHRRQLGEHERARVELGHHAIARVSTPACPGGNLTLLEQQINRIVHAVLLMRTLPGRREALQDSHSALSRDANWVHVELYRPRHGSDKITGVVTHMRFRGMQELRHYFETFRVNLDVFIRDRITPVAHKTSAPPSPDVSVTTTPRGFEDFVSKWTWPAPEVARIGESWRRKEMGQTRRRTALWALDHALNQAHQTVLDGSRPVDDATMSVVEEFAQLIEESDGVDVVQSSLPTQDTTGEK